jgi:hypothetical protein
MEKLDICCATVQERLERCHLRIHKGRVKGSKVCILGRHKGIVGNDTDESTILRSRRVHHDLWMRLA